jgi:hypothetical protein
MPRLAHRLLHPNFRAASFGKLAARKKLTSLLSLEALAKDFARSALLPLVELPSGEKQGLRALPKPALNHQP